ncbi:MAG TPA: N-acetylmuramoyl-L-alanine amidase [Blastocatellia bacterium]|nr:N-acetylmuramoyl-L-alanine amidase [Blastocatellia bacterium]
MWNSGFWNLESGIWNLEFWVLESGIWNLESAFTNH